MDYYYYYYFVKTVSTQQQTISLRTRRGRTHLPSNATYIHLETWAQH